MERIRSIPASGIGTTYSDLYIAPGAAGGLSGMIATCLQVASSGSAITSFSARVENAQTGTTVHLCNEIDIQPKMALNALGGKTVLEAGDRLQIKANVAGVLDVLLSGVEKTV